MAFLLKEKTFILTFFLGTALLLGKYSDAAKNQGTVTAQPGGYYDSGILGSGSGKHSKKGPKKTSKRHRHKSKGGETPIIQNPGESQEDVTDQKEVSDQADQPAKPGKRK